MSIIRPGVKERSSLGSTLGKLAPVSAAPHGAAGAAFSRKPKYRAQPVVVDGERFDSTSEYKRWCELKLLERAGQISELKHHVSYPLIINNAPVRFKSGRPARYVADYTYVENGFRVIEDRKGFQTAESKLKIAVVEAIYGVEVRLTRAKVGK